MPARLISGTTIAATIREGLEPRAAAFRARTGRPPALGIVLAGHAPASEIYVRHKMEAAGAIGVAAELIRIAEDASLQEVLDVVRRLNASDTTDGILVQSPLPSGMGPDAAQRVFDAIDPAKDVDGFHAGNVGRLVQNRAALVACTPAGVIEMLERSDIAIAGSHAVVVGRSDIVGKPVALLLLHRHATVTICHSRTRDLPAVARSADILIAAIGRAGFVTPDFVKPGATVVDVGINRVTDPALASTLFPSGSPRLASFVKRGSVVVGDVHPAVADVAGALTPVPGGVGPMTVAMLLTNTVRAAEMREEASHAR
jgi:methylenetetrahydrofolate dehydrogenase (NADP+)/methenyltetrahydrofolate cyclohydrolase